MMYSGLTTFFYKLILLLTAFSALFAVNMALTTENGWVFSDEELKGWMREAGLVPDDTLHAPPPMPHWLVVATKPANMV